MKKITSGLIDLFICRIKQLKRRDCHIEFESFARKYKYQISTLKFSLEQKYASICFRIDDRIYQILNIDSRSTTISVPAFNVQLLGIESLAVYPVFPLKVPEKWQNHAVTNILMTSKIMQLEPGMQSLNRCCEVEGILNVTTLSQSTIIFSVFKLYLK